MGEIKNVMVRWHLLGQEHQSRVTEVMLVEGYTDDNSIPRIISVALWSTNAHADCVVVDDVVCVDDLAAA